MVRSHCEKFGISEWIPSSVNPVGERGSEQDGQQHRMVDARTVHPLDAADAIQRPFEYARTVDIDWTLSICPYGILQLATKTSNGCTIKRTRVGRGAASGETVTEMSE
jgi:hypothetical protein